MMIEQWHQGVEMTWQQLGQLPHRHGVEAVSVRHDPGQPDHIVLEVTQRGYCRGDKVFRPAKVIVNDLNHSRGASHAH